MAFKITLWILFFLFLFSQAMGNIGNPTKLSYNIESIKELKGCCDKGSNAQGLPHLKLYLARFGYLNYQHTPTHTNVEDEKFDDELESSLKSYQKYYHLNETGTLNEATVSLMITPRCGLPDRETNHHTSKLLHTVSRYSLFSNRRRWYKSKLTYAFDPNYPNKHMPPTIRSFNQWSSAISYFSFSQVNNTSNADLKASFEKRDHGDGSPFGPSVYAHAFGPRDGRLHFNKIVNFSDAPEAVKNLIHLETVAAHETGHLLGLRHSNDKNALMYPYLDRGQVKGVTSDDIDGIKDLYRLK